ncbi:ATP-binding protein [Variovorax sp. RA8]|uniref:ATP-binding protein n=1 Tax=Variovorax sp. (strain JCM 16519 / RA8) TaxID=662548 RepID=UPI001316AF88|nr:ATP-binding protein [Variovorax sp. RA8]VTU37186.1 Signal transduction histidine-protein kinase BaeS [Variovorax sp. RA8]
MPRLTLTRKIFFALAALLVMLLLISAGFSIFALQRGLGPYVAEIEIRRMDWLAQLLQKHYAAQGNWNALRDRDEVWHRLQMGDAGVTQQAGPRDAEDARLPPWYARPARPEAEPGGAPGPVPPPQLELLPRRFAPPPPPWLFPGLRDAVDSIYRRLGVIDAAGQRVIGATVDPASAAHLPIRLGNLVVGQLVLAPVEGLASEADRAFLARQSGYIALTGAVGLGLALVLSWLLARRWLSPIDALTQGAQDVARGRLGTRVQVRGSDELALLGRTFNDMAERLDTVEASRRAWLADVAHELRTPLAAMRAEIEALQDGVRSFDDRTALRLHRQVMRLNQLVDDLRSSMREPQADSITRAPVFPLMLLKEALAATRDRFARRRIAVEAEAVDALAAGSQPIVEGDAQRLHQVFMNLLDNTLSYTDGGGTLRIDAAVEGSAGAQRLVLRFDDSAPGVAPGELPLLFERLFRAEGSRSRALGGSGLGLSICRAMVEAHGGEIDASASPLGGLRITLWLPLEEKYMSSTAAPKANGTVAEGVVQ